MKRHTSSERRSRVSDDIEKVEEPDVEGHMSFEKVEKVEKVE